MSNNRDADFSESTKEIISRRSGFRCAYLNCDKSTVGPGKGADDSENVSTVAHIFSASPNGPRGTGGLSADERKSTSNGMLVCSDHSRIVDTEKGKNYSASQLQSWKAMHESRIAKELKGLPATVSAGWIKGINFIETPVFKSGQKINFGKVTLISGDNGTGKTSLCEWLASASGQMRLMERWSYQRRSQNIKVEIEYMSPELSKADVEFKDTTFICKTKGTTVESLKHAFRVVYLRNENRGREVPTNDVEYLAYQWNIHPFQVPNILSKMGSEKYGFVRKAEIREVRIDEDDNENQDMEQAVYAQIGSHQSAFSFKALSGREQGQVLFIGAMIIAEELSLFTPTMLIIELSGTFFPDELLTIYVNKLAGYEFQFQTILITPYERQRVNWTGWSIAHLRGKAPNAEVHQDDIK